MVLVDRSFPELHVSSVLINNYEISYYSTQQLINRGCKNPAFVSYKQDQFHTNERKRGFIKAVKEAGIYKTENVKEVRYQYLDDDINNAIYELINNVEKNDGIFFATNSLSIAGIKSLLKHNIDIQKDVQVMCFDESEAFNLLPFSIPFIKQPIEEMAKKALKLLINQIEKKGNEIEKSFIDAQLIM